MKKHRKLMALLLAAAMSLSPITSAVFADETDEPAAYTELAEEAVAEESETATESQTSEEPETVESVESAVEIDAADEVLPEAAIPESEEESYVEPETEAPAAETEAPAAETEALAAETEAPAAETEAPSDEQVLLDAVAPKEITPTVALAKTSFMYDGTEKKPDEEDITVMDGSIVLLPHDHYDIEYPDASTAPGTYKITIVLKGIYKGTGEASYMIKCAAPVLVSAKCVYGGVSFNWEKSNGAAKYRVFRKKYNSATSTWSGWEAVADTANVTYSDKNVESGYWYKYAVRCISADGNTITSDYDSSAKNVRYLAAPVVTSLSKTVYGVKVNWKKVRGAARYQILRKVYDASAETWSGWISVGNTTSLYITDKTVKSGKIYKYTVRCVSADAKTATSGYKPAGTNCTYVKAPIIKKISNAIGGVYITWPKTAGAAKYRVYRKRGTGSWGAIGTTTSTAFTDKKAANGAAYRYTVQCLNSAGKPVSACDTTGKKIVFVRNTAIRSLTSPKKGQMKVRWGGVSYATGYHIFYSLKQDLSSGNKMITVKGGANISKTIKNLKSNRKYYVLVRAYRYVNGTTYFSAWSDASAVKIR